MTVAVRLAPSALLVFPLVETEKPGANFRLAQFVTWNGIDTGELAPSALSTRAGDPGRVAVRRVEREPRPGDVHVDVLDLQGDALDHVRDRIALRRGVRA